MLYKNTRHVRFVLFRKNSIVIWGNLKYQPTWEFGQRKRFETYDEQLSETTSQLHTLREFAIEVQNFKIGYIICEVNVSISLFGNIADMVV